MTDSFAPGPETERAFRTALGHFGTGVTVISARDDAGPVSITANSFSAVSLDPPLVLWSPAIASKRHDAFARAERFAIHVLLGDQLKVAQRAATDGRHFATEDWTEADGLPVLRRCLARFDCTAHAAHPAGDHTILLGRVDRAHIGTGTPLLFVQGQYGAFAVPKDS